LDDVALYAGYLHRKGKTLKLVSINIVNWNGLRFLGDCLKSIKSQTYENIEVNIIDNHSTDGSVEWLEKEYPEVRLVRNGVNEGFSRAHNQATRISSGEYILPLNFDIILSPQFVAEMVKAIEMASDIGIVSGNLYALRKGEDRKIIDSTGVTIKSMFPADRGQNQLDHGQYHEIEYVFGASGAAPLYRHTMLEEVALNGENFDEDYYIYVEDVDLCWRAQLYGWKALYTPWAVAFHKRGATREKSAGMGREYILLGHRNRYWSIIKNAILTNLLRNMLWILIVELRFYVGHLLGGNYFIFRILPMVMKGLPRMLRKRKEIQKRRKVCAEYMERFFFGDIRPIAKKYIVGVLQRKV
jgi:GT2 family glycosyltransferase